MTADASTGKDTAIANPLVSSLTRLKDRRGVLLFGQVGAPLPFTPIRIFTISEVPKGEERANHAHHELEEYFVCLKGACTVMLDDGRERQEIRLDTPETGLYKPRMYWVTLHSFTPDALLLVLASDIWRDEDHIKDYESFRKIAADEARQRESGK